MFKPARRRRPPLRATVFREGIAHILTWIGSTFLPAVRLSQLEDDVVLRLLVGSRTTTSGCALPFTWSGTTDLGLCASTGVCETAAMTESARAAAERMVFFIRVPLGMIMHRIGTMTMRKILGALLLMRCLPRQRRPYDPICCFDRLAEPRIQRLETGDSSCVGKRALMMPGTFWSRFIAMSN